MNLVNVLVKTFLFYFEWLQNYNELNSVLLTYSVNFEIRDKLTIAKQHIITDVLLCFVLSRINQNVICLATDHCVGLIRVSNQQHAMEIDLYFAHLL